MLYVLFIYLDGSTETHELNQGLDIPVAKLNNERVGAVFVTTKKSEIDFRLQSLSQISSEDKES